MSRIELGISRIGLGVMIQTGMGCRASVLGVAGGAMAGGRAMVRRIARRITCVGTWLRKECWCSSWGKWRAQQDAQTNMNTFEYKVFPKRIEPNKGYSYKQTKKNNHDLCPRALLENGAAVNSQEEDGWTALMFSEQSGHEQV